MLYSNARLGGGAHDGPDAWSVEAHLLAAAVDELNTLTWMTRAVHSRKPGKPPKPLPRPGMKAPAVATVTNPARNIPAGIPVVDLRTAGGDGHGD